MSVEVLTICSRRPLKSKEPYYHLDAYLASLDRLGHTPVMLGMDEPWGGLMTKPRRMRQWLRSGVCKADTLIICDAFDIVFTRSPREVAEVYRREWPNQEIVFNCERGIFPRGELAHKFEHVPGPWKYLNSGFIIGPPATILAMLESMWLDDIADDHIANDDLHGGPGTHINPNDQGHFCYSYAAQVVPIGLDHGCVLCQTLSECSLTDFDLGGEQLRNIEKDTYPMVWHFNGSKETLMPAFLRKWGLE